MAPDGTETDFAVPDDARVIIQPDRASMLVVDNDIITVTALA